MRGSVGRTAGVNAKLSDPALELPWLVAAFLASDTLREYTVENFRCFKLAPVSVAASLATVTLLLSGCAQMGLDTAHYQESEEQLSRVDKHSSFPAIRRETFEQVNLVELLDPEGAGRHKYGREPDSTQPNGAVDWGKKYDLAFAAFRESSASADHKRMHRNSVQDRILGVSTSRCNVFKTYLRRQQANTNFLLGSATTAAGVLGAVLPGATASRNLAGAAGLFSGIQAEYNANYFANVAAHVIIQGIELRQSRLLKEVVEKRQRLGVADYTMEAAVKDAIYFDGTCSAVTGLLEAGDSIQEVNSPGLGRAVEIITAVKAANEIAQAPSLKELQDSGRLTTLLKQATPSALPLVVSAVKTESPESNLQQQLATASGAEARVKESLGLQVAAVEKIFVDSQAKLAKADQSKEVKPGDVSARYEAAVGEEIKKVPLSSCVAGLKAPSNAYGQALYANTITGAGSPEKITTEDALGKAKTSAETAIKRVNMAVQEINRILTTTAQSWESTLKGKSLTKASIAADKLTASAANMPLQALCPTP